MALSRIVRMSTGVVTEEWPSSGPPTPGTRFELTGILMGEIRQGKLIHIREYFDELTPAEAGTAQRLFT